MNPEDLHRLVTTQMPFGKYKGRLIADLPGHYLNWFAREGFPPGQIGRLLALMQELDHNGLKGLLDLSTREKVIIYPLVFFVILFGVYPAPVLDVTAASVDALVNNVTLSIEATQAATLR